MRSKSRKLISTLLAAVMAFCLLTAMPITASALDGPIEVTVNPVGVNYLLGNAVVPLKATFYYSVGPEVPDYDFPIKVQWFWSLTDSNTGRINGLGEEVKYDWYSNPFEYQLKLEPPTDTIGVRYYYCVLQYTLSVTFETREAVTEPAKIEVFGPATISPESLTFEKGGSGDVDLAVDKSKFEPVSIKNGDYTLVAGGVDFKLNSDTSMTLKADYLNTLDEGTHTLTFNFSAGPAPILTITVTAASVAPTITGPTTMTLAQDYAATSTGVFTVTGTPAPTVTKTDGDAKITWNNATKKLDVAAGLAAGTYPVVLTATSGTETATLTFTLTVTPAIIIGPTAMTLTVGYAATSTDAYTTKGTPAPTVVKTSGDAKITWNNTTKKLDVAAGLAAGTYPIVLTATSGTETATLTFTLTVKAAMITGPASMTLAEGYAATSTDVYTMTGAPTPTVIKTSGDANITWNNTTKKLDVAAGLTAGTYPVVLTAISGTDTETLTFTLTVLAVNSASMANFVKSRTYFSGMFVDVDENQWYGSNEQKVIANAYEYGLMQGSGNTFNPLGNMTIAEAITIAARVHHIYNGGNGEFTQGSPWYQVYADYAIEKGIVNAGTFSDYNKAATRAEMAYIFSRALPETEFAPQNFVNALPDVNSGTPYYDAIIMLYRAGVVAGSDNSGTFNPGDNITRAEAAAIISRVVLKENRMGGKTFG